MKKPYVLFRSQISGIIAFVLIGFKRQIERSRCVAKRFVMCKIARGQ